MIEELVKQINSLQKQMDALVKPEIAPGGTSSHGFIAKNTSGATANVGDVGYIDASGEYKTTTTANLNASWCVVLSSGTNNSDIYVTRRGKVNINYTGSAPSTGNYLVTSTSAGLAAAQTTMRPEIFAVCLAAGSAGVVSALLLTQRTFSVYTSGNDILAVVGSSSTDFVATQNGAPSGANITYNAPSSGNENTIVPIATTQLAKIVIHNTTRGTSAYLQATNTGTNVMTFTSAADVSGWQNGDTLTARSQTNTDVIASRYFYDLVFTSELPTLTTALMYNVHQWVDSGTAGQVLFVTRWTASGPRLLITTQVAGISFQMLGVTIPIINNRFCIQWSASGTGTASPTLRIAGYFVASP